MRFILGLTTLLLLVMLAPAASAKSFSNCSAMNATYKGGVAKSKTAQKKAIANGVKTMPTINAKVYAENASKDRDKDGVACEQ